DHQPLVGEPVLGELEALPDLEARGATIIGPAPVPKPHPDSAAYLLFTSGSTGAPKGVVVSHRALVNRLRWMQEAYPLGGDDRVLQKTPAGFDVSVWEYFWPTTVGAAAVISAPDGHRDPWYLRRVVEQTGVSVLHFVPSMLAVFTESLDAGSAQTALSSVRAIFTSGEALTPGVVAATAALTSAPVHNLYGPTEAAIDVTHHDACDPNEPVIPIGSPIHNTTAYVLDRRLAPRPVGAVGELYLGGVQLARGYRGRPDLTAERFVADPFGSGARLYRTGDLVRQRMDGEIEYLGRSDSQIKIRGQRVELGEIEAALAALPAVRTAGVTVRDDLLDDRVIIGYVTGADLSDRDLRAELAAAVPPHMIPTAVMVCDALPTTANGKLDRRALPDPDLAGGGRDDVEATTALERLVLDTVRTVLDLSDPSMSSGFFAIGGNSLSATRVAARLSTATGVRLGLRDVFDATDLRGIAATLHALGASPDTSSTREKPRHTAITGLVPLSPAQHRIWLTNRLDPASAATYNVPFAVRLTGELVRDALVAALNDVVARHEPLRTVVVEENGIAYQRVLPADRGLFTVEHLVADAATQGADGVEEFAARPFDLADDLPIRARLTSQSDREHTLAVVIHHIAADGWSLAPLADDLAHAYRARISGAAPTWTDLPVTYRQSAADRLAWLDDPTSDASDQLAFWSETLEDAPVESGLPYDHPPTRAGARTGEHIRVPIEAATRARLFALAHRLGVTGFMVIHAALAAVLRTTSDTDDIVIGTPVSGRGSGDLDSLVGMFVNTLALRTRVDKDASFGDLLAEIRDCDLEAFDNADIPFDRLVTELNPDRRIGGQPYFDVSVAFEDAAEVALDFEDLTATATRIDTGTSKFSLEFTVTDRHDDPRGGPAMELLLGYAAELFDRITAAGLASRFVRLLDTVTEDPDITVGDACVLDPADRLDLVPAVGGGARPAEHLSQLIDTAAATAAHHPAIVDTASSRSLTYRELDMESNRLARTLIAAGAGPEDFVALALPRGAEWMVALFAVAKTGAAWVPVDPSHPRTRIEFMLADSGVEVVITDRAAAVGLPTDASHTVLLVDETDDDPTSTDRPITAGERHAEIDIDQPAYLIYTSGTTGRPKGVVVSHRGLADLAAEQVASLTMHGDSRTLHLASPSFDASILEVIMAVGAAATMHIAPAGTVGGRELVELMNDAGITHAFLTPSLLTTMSPDDLPHLESLVIGGESPNSEAVRRWAAGHRVINAYGPTEATVVATMSPPIAPTDAVTIGRPIRGVSALVLDERLRPVPPGAVGELYLCGSHLARGYHRVPSLTSKHFIANPLSHDGERMYRTGDLVRWTAGRSLEFRGRSDHQAKVRGHRI
ncbi:MAG: amino acid adenylation domain-containing protein, partial [Gordonia sp. (in: high G+C Gram-positive bacteria)]|nr:amino acid adenylation domain-containing protein [Gordonia sp. (in: high G+C Gram-positive bacteria)]